MTRAFLPSLLACVVLCACAERPEPPPEPRAVERTADVTIATVDGEPIGADAVRLAIVRRGGDFLGRYAKLDEKEKVVEELVRVKLLARAARAQGYDREPEIQAAIEQILADRYWQQHLAPREVPEVTDADVEGHYEDHAGDFTDPERARAAVIFVAFPADADDETKAAARRTALELREQARALPATERTFGSLAERSDDPTTRRRGGDLGFLARGAEVYSVERAVHDALFALERPGDIAEPVETERGVYLVKLVERTGGGRLPLETVRTAIRQRLYDARVSDAEAARYAELRDEADVRLDRELLGTVGPSAVASSGRPPSFPVGEATP